MESSILLGRLDRPDNLLGQTILLTSAFAQYVSGTALFDGGAFVNLQ